MDELKRLFSIYFLCFPSVGCVVVLHVGVFLLLVVLSLFKSYSVWFLLTIVLDLLLALSDAHPVLNCPIL